MPFSRASTNSRKVTCHSHDQKQTFKPTFQVVVRNFEPEGAAASAQIVSGPARFWSLFGHGSIAAGFDAPGRWKSSKCRHVENFHVKTM